MKLVLCLIVVALSTYIGRMLSKKAASRLEFFRAYQSAMIHLTDSVVGLNLELYKALKTARSEIKPFFLRCADMLKNSPQQPFGRIWEQSFQVKSGETSLNKEDIRIILDGGEAIETLCSNPSEKQAAAYLKRLAAYIGDMEIEKRKKCKMYNAGGVLAGLFIALLMI